MMNKITTLSLAAAAFAVAACGNDVDVNTDTSNAPTVDTAAGLAVPTPMDTSLRTDTTLRDTLNRDTTANTKKTPY